MMVHFTRLVIEKAWRWNEGRSSLVLDLWYLRSFWNMGLKVYNMQLIVWTCSQGREPGLEHRCTETLVCRGCFFKKSLLVGIDVIFQEKNWN